ncbi:interleukin-15 receptor subunit alpha isoform X2 [Struthio camelus]|uniref:interleukin-15 receptor subunit alpha isoform X2 n=1 Tax=Struthio camelus TaxID=8801 RepID=UPI003603FE90
MRQFGSKARNPAAVSSAVASHGPALKGSWTVSKFPPEIPQKPAACSLARPFADDTTRHAPSTRRNQTPAVKAACLGYCTPPASASPARCSRPREVANAHIDAGDTAQLNARLRYACKPGYKRKAGTSSLTQCVLPPGAAEPVWTQPTLQCIRDPVLPPLAPSPEPPAPGHPQQLPGRVSAQTALLAFGLSGLFVAGLVAGYCCWRMKARRSAAAETAVPMTAAGPGESAQMLPPGGGPAKG